MPIPMHPLLSPLHGLLAATLIGAVLLVILGWLLTRSGATWHAYLPWDWLEGFYQWFRRAFFSSPEPTGRPGIRVKASLEEIREALGSQGWAPNWEFSYYKRGEDLNLAHVELWIDHDLADGDGEQIIWWQSHVRGWAKPDGVVLRAHWEPEATEHPRGHLDGVGHDVERGMTELESSLRRAGIEIVERV